VFFELREKEKQKLSCLNAMVRSDTWFGGYFGGLVLRCVGHAKQESGRIHLSVDSKPDHASVLEGKRNLGRDAVSRQTKVRKDAFVGAFLVWMEAGFAMFAFDLIAMLQGRYRPARLSSKHGIGASV
jgi:hypothetical protein